MFSFFCKLRRRHSWEAFEVYSGEWFLVCRICKAVRPVTGDEVGHGDHR